MTFPYEQSSPSGILAAGVALDRQKQCILAVDDAPENIQVLNHLLGDEYQIKVATRGAKALEIARRQPQPDLILLDVMMPEMDGYEVCRQLKADPETADIPVVFVTGKADPANELEGFSLGALDYITKPFHPAVIKARVHTHLQLRKERRKSEALLENILPRKVIKDLKDQGFSRPELFDPVTVMFADLVGFTPAAAQVSPVELIRDLSELFSTLDDIVARHGAERIKTIGDAYLAVCGMPTPDPRHAQVMVDVSLEFLRFLASYNQAHQKSWRVRIGLDTGAVVGGIVGTNRYVYDVFGDAVNTASRVQSGAEPMTLRLTERTWAQVRGDYPFQALGAVELKGKGPMNLYALGPPSP